VSEDFASELIACLGGDSLRCPETDEKEERFSSTAVVPAIQKALRPKALDGVYVTQGEGSRDRRACKVGAWHLYPDVTVVEARVGETGRPLAAIEVKYLRGGQSLATAIGQTILYRSVGAFRVVILFGVCDTTTHMEELLSETAMLRQLYGCGVAVLLRPRDDW